MSTDQPEIFQGQKIEIAEMILKKVDNQLELSWKIYIDQAIVRLTFHNVSRLRTRELSVPLEVHGFEVIKNSQSGWEKDSLYEVRDFEDDRINFFCERFDIDK